MNRAFEMIGSIRMDLTDLITIDVDTLAELDLAKKLFKIDSPMKEYLIK